MRLGFLGVGWPGRHRLEALAKHGSVDIAAISDPSRERRDAALAIAPGAQICDHLGQLLELPLDGIVIATPSALHADQCIAALERGRAVFCQKPLARSAAETRRVVDCARAHDRLLGVDLSYRYIEAMQRIRAADVGRVFAADLVFHAYGPDAPWFHDRVLSGGGCVIDLGVHLVDLALWLLDYPQVLAVDSRLYAGGLPAARDQCEDFAVVHLHLASGAIVRLACSWRLSIGRDCAIEAALYGSAGSVVMKNVDGSAYDFVAEHHRGTKSERLAAPPDEWGGRAAIAWTEQLAAGAGFDPDANRFIALAQVIDAIYGGLACAY